MSDKGLCHELREATGFELDVLNDYFKHLAANNREREKDAAFTLEVMTGDRHMDYETFIDILRDEGVLADKRSVFRVMSRLKTLESNIDAKFEEFSRLHPIGGKLAERDRQEAINQ